MRLTNTIALLLIISFDWFMINFFSIKGNDHPFIFYLYFVMKFLCYFVPILIFSKRDKILGIRSLFVIVIIGSLLFLIYFSIVYIYGDWQYLSAHLENLKRFFELMFLPQLSDLIIFNLLFLSFAFSLPLIKGIFARRVHKFR